MSGETLAVREALPVYATEAPETERVPLGYRQTEVGMIPEDWELLSIGSMGEVVAGKALAAKAPGLQRPYLRTKNVFDGRIDINDVLSMPMTDAEFARYKLRDGDVLLNEGQALELVGRCSIYQGEFPEPCAIQNQLIRFRARNGVSPTFAAHLFRYCQKTGVFARIALQTTSVAHLGVSRFQKLTLAWPVSETEQRAIAAALSDVDALICALDKLIAKKRAVKTTTMQQLLTGKQRLPGFGGEWRVKQFGDVFSFLGTANNPRSDLSEHGEVGYIHYGDLHATASSFLDCSSAKTPHIARSIVSNIPRLEEGDLIMVDASEDYEGVGKSVEVKNLNGRELVAGLHTFLLRGDKEKLANGFKGYLQYIPRVRSALVRLATGISVYGISKNSLRSIEVNLPRIEEQTAIATVLSDMDAEIAALEARREKTRRIKQGMMQELLTGRTRLV